MEKFRELTDDNIIKIWCSEYEYWIIKEDGSIAFTNEYNFNTNDIKYFYCNSNFEDSLAIQSEVIRRDIIKRFF